MPTCHFINGFWSDVIAVLGLLGLALTFYQVWKTKNASEAATKSAIDALEKARKHYDRHIKYQCLKTLSEARVYISIPIYSIAALKMNDIHEMIIQSTNRPEEAKQLATRAASMGHTFERIHRSEIQFAKSSQAKWNELVIDLSAFLSQNPHQAESTATPS